MSVINRKKNALKSKITLKQFGDAMSQLNLAEIPEERRAEALKDHLLRVMGSELVDPAERFVMNTTRLLNAKVRG